MLIWITNIFIKNEVIFHKIASYAETTLLLGMNIMTIGMIDWVAGLGSILESTPAMLLTLSMVLLNLAKFAQIIVDVLIKKKKELDKLKEKDNESSNNKDS